MALWRIGGALYALVILALLAIFFNLVSISVEAAADLNLIDALSPLGNCRCTPMRKGLAWR